MLTEKKLIKIFEKKGIFDVSDSKYEKLLMDSLMFISLIVCIEKEFNIEIDDSYYVQNKLETFNDFKIMIQNKLEQYEKE